MGTQGPNSSAGQISWVAIEKKISCLIGWIVPSVPRIGEDEPPPSWDPVLTPKGTPVNIFCHVLYDWPVLLYSNPMNMTLRDRIRKKREEDGDDMMLFILPALSLLESNRGGEKK